MRFQWSVRRKGSRRAALVHGETGALPSSELGGCRVSRVEGLRVTDGPFTESKEVLGG